MKKLLILLVLFPFFSKAQEVTNGNLIKMYLIAVEDFHSSPLIIHEKDSRTLVSKPNCTNEQLPDTIGLSNIEWICFEGNLTNILKGNINTHNGRSIILSSHRQPNPDTITIRVDQWTLGNIGQGTRFSPIDETKYPEYKKKNHEYLFVKTGTKWELKSKANRLKPISNRDKEIEEIFQKGNSLNRQGKYKEALEHVERSMSMDSSMYQRYLFMAGIKVKLGMFESAIADVSKCIERCDIPSNRDKHIAYYLYRRAEIHEQNKDITSALSDLDKSISLDNEKPERIVKRATLNQRLNNLDKACNDYKTLITKGFKEHKRWVKQNCK